MSGALAKVFNYEGYVVRTNVVDGDPWFCLQDVGTVLGLKNPRSFVDTAWCDGVGVKQMMANDVKGKAAVDNSYSSLGQKRARLFISEGNLYALVMRSSKPEAKAFSRWLSHDVVPALRRTGTYSVGDDVSNHPSVVPADPVLATIEAMGQLRREQLAMAQRIEALEQMPPQAPLLALPFPTKDARARVRMIVGRVSGLTGEYGAAVWGEVYRRYEKATGIDLSKAKELGVRKIDMISKTGGMPALARIVEEFWAETVSHLTQRPA